MQDPACRNHNARCRTKREAILVLIVCLLAVAVPVLAQSSTNYDLWWHVVAGGGGRMESANHTLLGTIGQPEVGPMASDDYILGSGFWAGGALAGKIYPVYLPIVLEGHSR
jgi:hypothetical protein